MPKVLKAKKLVNALNNHVVYAIPDSVCGCLQDLMMVGIAANPSLAIANRIAIKGSFVIPHNINAKTEHAPQI